MQRRCRVMERRRSGFINDLGTVESLSGFGDSNFQRISNIQDHRSASVLAGSLEVARLTQQPGRLRSSRITRCNSPLQQKLAQRLVQPVERISAKQNWLKVCRIVFLVRGGIYIETTQFGIMHFFQFAG